MKIKLLEMNAAMYIHLCNIAFCQDKYNKKWKMFNLIKLLADINVLKVFLKSSSYQYEENGYGRFRHALTDHHFNPSPLATNWPFRDCRQITSISMRRNSMQCLTLAVQWDVKIELKYSQNFRKWYEREKVSTKCSTKK